MDYSSQSGQDRFFHEVLFKGRRNGAFLDIGAHDGVTFSNTCFLERQLGWTGICVEPIPAVFARLERNRRAICINGCVVEKDGPRTFTVLTGACEMLSGISDQYDERHRQRIQRELADTNGTSASIEAIGFSVESLCRFTGMRHFDLCCIDTEGSELEILEGIDFAQVAVAVFCVENNYHDPRIGALLQGHGYGFIARIGEDEIYGLADRAIPPVR